MSSRLLSQKSLWVGSVILVTTVSLHSCGDSAKNKAAQAARTKSTASSDATAKGAGSITDKEQTGKMSGVFIDSIGACLNHLLLGDIDIAMAMTECKNDPVANNPKPSVITPNPVVVATPTPTPTPSVSPSVTPPAASNIVAFSIAAGTGTGAWNTKEGAVQVKVGQILRITNNDAIVHQMHTGNSEPCPHGPPIAAGATWDCAVGRAVNSTLGATSSIYAHGRTAASSPFYVIAIP